jgi:hypothetical protein
MRAGCDNRAIAFPRAPSIVTADSKANRPSMQTPCIKVCTLDARSGLCLGCGRTLDQIARWASMSEAERAGIMAELAQRGARDAVAAAG